MSGVCTGLPGSFEFQRGTARGHISYRIRAHCRVKGMFKSDLRNYHVRPALLPIANQANAVYSRERALPDAHHTAPRAAVHAEHQLLLLLLARQRIHGDVRRQGLEAQFEQQRDPNPPHRTRTCPASWPG